VVSRGENSGGANAGIVISGHLPPNRVGSGAEERLQLFRFLNVVTVEIFVSAELLLEGGLEIRAHSRDFGQMAPVGLIVI
jgi:hypothetical protein